MNSSGSQIEGGSGTHIISAKVRRTIQTIKEIVSDHSDADIYVALKDSNMDPNETTQKLLNQDPFREVKRKRDKKKENVGYKGSVDPRRQSEDAVVGTKLHNFLGHNARRGGYSRNVPGAGVSREFRIVRDNRINQAKNREWKPASPKVKPVVEKVDLNVPQKGSMGTPNSKKISGRPSSFQGSNQPSNSQVQTGSAELSASGSRKTVEENGAAHQNGVLPMQMEKPKNSHTLAVTLASTSSIIGVYSSSTDPVHVPSPDSRSSSAIGAIKREVGVVGGRRRSTDSTKPSSVSSSSFSNSLLGRPSSSESLRPFSTIHKTEQLRQRTVTESVMPISQANRLFLNNHHGNKSHQPAGHQKAPQPSKEWKPKSIQKSISVTAGVNGVKSTSPSSKNPNEVEQETAEMLEKFSEININENQNVIIADHIRVVEADRCHLRFGSFGMEFDSSGTSLSGFDAARASEESNQESAASLSVSAPESSADEASGTNLVDGQNDQARNSTSDSSALDAVREHKLPGKEESQNPQDLESYADIGLVGENSPSCGPTEPHQQQEHPNIPNFSQAYDPQSGYDIPYFRHMTDESLGGQGLASPQESLSSHTASNGIPASTVAMMQQQQQPVAQMYPPVQVSHFTLPYRQFLSPVYVPPMAMPGYSSSPAYPHPSNGSSYLLMPGGSSHLGAGGLKYGIQQFKPVGPGNPTGFGNFTGPSGYAMNASGVVGSGTGLEDSSRLKYKDGNLYVQNPQAETSELWVQNPRELPSLQSAPYYNMPGQTPHAAYLPSHTGHASFNAVAAQSSHMPFSGLYHPPQPNAIPSPHHLGPTMGTSVQVGVAAAAPGAQVGAYQQPPQLGVNWTGNF